MLEELGTRERSLRRGAALVELFGDGWVGSAVGVCGSVAAARDAGLDPLVGGSSPPPPLDASPATGVREAAREGGRDDMLVGAASLTHRRRCEL